VPPSPPNGWRFAYLWKARGLGKDAPYAINGWFRMRLPRVLPSLASQLLDLTKDLCHFSIYLSVPAQGAFLIQNQKGKSIEPSSALPQAIEHRIPGLNGNTDPFSFVTAELEMVEQTLAQAIRSREPALTNIAGHLIYGGGKRVRPMVALLAFLTFGGKKIQEIVDIATAIELIHTATLLHDDIIDGAETRRGKESAYRKYGLKSTLVAGDFLFIRAFEFAGKFDETVVQWTADACALLTEGEMLQGHFNRNRSVTLENYVEIVKRKTASLFQTGAKVGAYLAGANATMVEETDLYGLNMGIAFQMIDDILDIVGHVELLGKPTGMDLRDGNPSLPIILALQNGQDSVCRVFECLQPTEAQIGEAIEALKNGSVIEQARSISKGYAERALTSVKKLPPSLYRNGLKTLVQLIIDRDF
jgi:octaprenyl-diphosphate synthase